VPSDPGESTKEPAKEAKPGIQKKAAFTSQASLPDSVGELFSLYVFPDTFKKYVERLGADDATLIRDLVSIPEEDLLAAMNALTDDETLKSPLARGKVVRFVRDLFEASGVQAPLLGAAPPTAKTSTALASASTSSPGDPGALVDPRVLVDPGALVDLRAPPCPCDGVVVVPFPPMPAETPVEMILLSDHID